MAATRITRSCNSRRLSLRFLGLPLARTPGAALLQRRFNGTISSDPKPSDDSESGPYTPPSLSKVKNGTTLKDNLHVGPAKQLTVLLSDLLPATFEYPSIHGQGKVMPQGHHLAYFPIRAVPSQLASDGAESEHVPGGFDLTKPGATRLWVGGSLLFTDEWARQLRFFKTDEPNLPYSWICKEKFANMRVLGRGDQSKAVVELKRTYAAWMRGRGDVGIEETRLLAFVPRFEPQAKSFGAPGEPDFEYKFTPTPEQLFQFSALTNNAHFIHLDREKSIVHGPLTLALMLRALTHTLGGSADTLSWVQKISYRNLRPLYVGQEATICLRKRPEKLGRSAEEVERTLEEIGKSLEKIGRSIKQIGKSPEEIGKTPEESGKSSEDEKGSISVWDVWIQEPVGGMAVKATAYVKTVPRTAQDEAGAKPPKTENLKTEDPKTEKPKAKSSKTKKSKTKSPETRNPKTKSNQVIGEKVSQGQVSLEQLAQESVIQEQVSQEQVPQEQVPQDQVTGENGPKP
ncbi:unnamed protein product [Clonostachys rosea]|uniref:MaoC-like domain-containing protein n=1 Tax=Bionectria ochroleuca TaxID=29856 RepID=A0ABY6TRC9_BIOOC|nr:unnamed protein product [Clonostachys rosea]